MRTFHSLLIAALLPGCATLLAQPTAGRSAAPSSMRPVPACPALKYRPRTRDKDPDRLCSNRRRRLHPLQPAARDVPVDRGSRGFQDRHGRKRRRDIGDTARADIQLEVGNVAESVEVTGSARPGYAGHGGGGHGDDEYRNTTRCLWPPVRACASRPISPF